MAKQFIFIPFVIVLWSTVARGDVGDPQIRTDHPWYPGELACSTFERLFETQAQVYERVTGKRPVTDQDKALASWVWRNTHYAHGEEGTEDLWGQGFTSGQDLRTREYWTGLFAHGFGLCGTTHSQWIAEMQARFGHNRGRGVGVSGHNSFEVFLTGGEYGDGKWCLLDHDISTVIFSPDGNRLLSLAEVQKDHQRLASRSFQPDKQNGWLVCGLHPDDGGVYSDYKVAEYLAGYSGPPPIVHLRRGERLRRYLEPGLEDGKTFVFWGRNYNVGGIPGPERSLTWVNQPEKMHGSTEGTPHKPGQARYGNAEYVYQPDFSSGDYKEGVIAEDDSSVTLEFYTPYIIGATPASAVAWAIYEPGCTNGLRISGNATCVASISVDQGATWMDCGILTGGKDLTDHVKGRRQYWLKLHAPAKALAGSGLTITTVCQANAAVLPRLKDDGTTIDFVASGTALMSAGPNKPQAASHIVDGSFGTPKVTLELQTPRGEPAVAIYAAAHVQSGNPPQPNVKYQIDYSQDGGKTWTPMVKDWSITRRGDEPGDFWSQSMCWGDVLLASDPKNVRARFTNTGGRNYARGEAHLVYKTPSKDGTRVTFAWTDDRGEHKESHTFAPSQQKQSPWKLAAGKNVKTHWVEFEPIE